MAFYCPSYIWNWSCLTVVLGNVMCYSMSVYSVNACKTCNYWAHNWLGNARPVSYFLVKCAHG